MNVLVSFIEKFLGVKEISESRLPDPEEDWASILDCPVSYYEVSVKKGSAHVTEAFQKARLRGKQQGFIPLLIHTEGLFQKLNFFLEKKTESFDDLTLAQRLKKWHNGLKDETFSGGQEILEELIISYFHDISEKMPKAAFDSLCQEKYVARENLDDILVKSDQKTIFNDSSLSGLFLGTGLTVDFYPSLFYLQKDRVQGLVLAEIPTSKPWELPFYLPVSGPDKYLSPVEQATVFRYWYEAYGAVPAVVGSQTWELLLPEPPEGTLKGVRLAFEHLAFCPDRLEKGSGSLLDLAGTILNSRVWYFRWDDLV